MTSPPTNPPNEDKLRLLVANGKDCIDVAQSLIDKFKLPYIIVQTEPEKWELRSAYTAGELFLQKFITDDEKMLQMKDDALKMSNTPYEVLVCGETGTGKELIASSQIGSRSGSIKTVNCAGFPRDLIESELFGHTRGAFTGATETKDGLMTSAMGGVMFLDEIGDLPLEVQSKFLRAIQYKVIRKVGSNREEKIDCKFVCATNKDLKAMVKEGTFREDLYARLCTLQLDISPLRDRPCDVIPITKSLIGGQMFLDKYGEELAAGMFDLSLNVRSLQQLVIRYAVLGRVSLKR